ncbi:protein modification by small protein conjugation or removal [Coemansia javaensis]|uniref:Protein modification by small protein conjugation or removal n=1 Tax=Coemansia javaensis TaxID=2761396 RepID=A0A9W8HNS4_9FUNG|nr:protein modification by small protein conjugation or removal [Coemansia javaensis]
MGSPARDESAALPAFVRRPRESPIDFGGLAPQYAAPMHYPTEVDLYEPSLRADGMLAPPGRGQLTAKAEVEVHLPCGFFNIWRALHDRRTPVAPRLARFFATAPERQQQATWDSRISYSSVDDEYYENGLALPFIKSWDHGVLHQRGVIRKVEHDWMMAYLAPSAMSVDGGECGLVWRFNYAESGRVVDRFEAVLGFCLFAESAAVEWCIRPLSQRTFRRIPIHILADDEARWFAPEGATNDGSDRGSSSSNNNNSRSPRPRANDARVLEERARIAAKHRGCILARRLPGDEHNSYAVASIPELAADLSEYVAGDHGFELAVSLTPAAAGDNRWQKAQIARQDMHHPVAGRTGEGEDALTRCGLDFRVRLRDEVPVPPVAAELVRAVGDSPRLRMDGAGADFVIRIHDPENTAGSLQPPVRAHERVLRAGSDYFAALLASPMAEAAAKEVLLDGMPYGPARLAIHFLYSDAIPGAEDMDLGAWAVLLGVASRLHIPRLIQLCQAHILREVQASVAAAEQQGAPDGGYRDLVPCPDQESIASLRAVADETGARDLLHALDRLVEYYPICVCEARIRRGPPDEFVARPSPHFSWDRMPDGAGIGHPDLDPLDHMRGGGFWPPWRERRHPLHHHRHPVHHFDPPDWGFGDEADFDLPPFLLPHAPMPGPVVQHAGPEPQGIAGIFGQLMNGWHIVGHPHHHPHHHPHQDGALPPDPEPETRPDPEPRTEAGADAEVEAEPHTVTEAEAEPRTDAGPAPNPETTDPAHGAGL